MGTGWQESGYMSIFRPCWLHSKVKGMIRLRGYTMEGGCGKVIFSSHRRESEKTRTHGIQLSGYPVEALNRQSLPPVSSNHLLLALAYSMSEQVISLRKPCFTQTLSYISNLIVLCKN